MLRAIESIELENPEILQTGVSPLEREGTLEVIILWGDHVIRVDEISATSDYTLTGLDVDTEIPLPLLRQGKLQLGGFREVQVAIGHAIRNLAELHASGLNELALPQGAVAQAKVGEFSVLVRSGVRAEAVGVPLPLRDPKGALAFARMPIDAFSGTGSQRKYTWMSAGIVAATLGLFALLPPKSAALSYDLMHGDEAFARYVVTPEETPEVDDPTPTPGGAPGQAAAGESGQAGRENAPHTQRRAGVVGDADHVELPTTAAERAANAGIIGTLASALATWQAPTSAFGAERPLGQDALAALGALTGAEVGDSFGYNSLGPHGTGRGGGGDGRGTMGLGDRIGTLGGRDGEGGRYGSGRCGDSDCLSGNRNSRVPGRITAGTATAVGSLSPEVIRRAIHRQVPQVQHCYESGLLRRPDLAGRVTVGFAIAPSGAVTHASISASTLADSDVESCILRAITRIAFPQPEGGGQVAVQYPFTLTSQ